MRTSRMVALSALAAAAAAGCGSSPYVLNRPAEIARIAVDPAAYPDAGGVYLLVDTKRGQTRAATHTIVHEVYRILRDSGLKNAERAFVYLPSERVEIEVARTILPDGAVVEADRDSVQDGYDADTGEHSKHITLPRAVVGSTLDFQYSLRYDSRELLAEGGYFISSSWFPLLRSDPVRHGRVVIQYPAESVRQLAAPNVAQSPETRQYLRPDGGSEVQYTFPVRDLPGLSEERYTPDADDARLLPQILASNFPDWNRIAFEIGLDYFDLQKTDSAFEAAVDAVLAGAASDEEKIRRAFQHVVRKLRWAETAPVSTYFKTTKPSPRAPLEILPSGFASPSEKSRVLLSMLERAGVKAHPAFVRPGKARLVPTQVPLYGPIHQKLLVAVEEAPDRFRFLDPTRRYSSLTHLPADVQGHTAFVVTGRQSGRFAQVPAAPPLGSSWDESQTIELAADGAVTLTSRLELTGEHALRMRARLGAAGKAEWSSLFAQAGEQVARIEPSNLEETDEPLRVAVQSKLSSFATTSGTTILVAPRVAPPDFHALPVGRKRRFVLQLDFPFAKRVRGTVRLPKGFRVRQLPPSERLDSQHGFGNAGVRYAQAQGEVSYDASFTNTVYQLSPEGYEEFVRHWQRVAAALAQPIVLERE